MPQHNLFGAAIEDRDGNALRRHQYTTLEARLDADNALWIAVEQECADYRVLRFRARNLATGEDRWFTFDEWTAWEPFVRANERLYEGPVSKAFAARFDDDTFATAVELRAGPEIAGDLRRLLDLQRGGNAMLWGQAAGHLSGHAVVQDERFQVSLTRLDTGASIELDTPAPGGANLHALLRDLLWLATGSATGFGWANCATRGEPCTGCSRCSDPTFLDAVFAAVAQIQSLGGHRAARAAREQAINPRRRRAETADEEPDDPDAASDEEE